MPAPLPFQANQAQSQAPAAAQPAAQFGALSVLATAETFDGTPPKPGHGQYRVRIDRLVNYRGIRLITEYTIVEASGAEASPVGFKSSASKELLGKGAASYAANQTLTQMGYSPTSPEAKQIQPYLPAIVAAETTGQAVPGPTGEPVQPGSIVGQVRGLTISPNIDPETGNLRLSKKNGKYYPKETWTI